MNDSQPHISQPHIIDIAKQAELCYQDTLKVIADAKQKLFDVTRWIVNLQSLILAASFSKQMEFSQFIIFLPIFVGLIGAVLNITIDYELKTHRKTLALIRKTIGGFAYEINQDQVDYFIGGKRPRHFNYFIYYKYGNIGIVILSSLLTLGLVLLQQFVRH